MVPGKARVERALDLKRLFRIEVTGDKDPKRCWASLMFFNKLYDKLRPPKVVELLITRENEQSLYRMLADQIAPTEQKLVVIERASSSS